MGKHLPFSCNDVELCAAALLDGQLSPAEEQLVEEHLETCEACCDLINVLSEQQLEPPRLQIIQTQDYWDEMDAVLQEELERAEESTAMVISWPQIALYAAVLIVTVLWVATTSTCPTFGTYSVYPTATLEHLERAMIQEVPQTAAKPYRIPTKWSCKCVMCHCVAQEPVLMYTRLV